MTYKIAMPLSLITSVLIFLNSCGPLPGTEEVDMIDRPENEVVVIMRPGLRPRGMQPPSPRMVPPSLSESVQHSPAEKISGKSSKNLKAGFVKAHNDARKKLGLPTLEWDDSIAAYAQEWADKLKKAKCSMRHRSGSDKKKRYGENLAWNWSSAKVSKTPEYATKNWLHESKDYNASTNTCKAGKVCGHYTQVVWKTTKRFGCGVAVCDGSANAQGSGRAEIWVCNYDPPGNIIGKRPF